ncbi:MAG: hypothetical protein IK015_04720 [Treponema sp.]|nr:hypothetical protein [Treponema sp.]
MTQTQFVTLDAFRNEYKKMCAQWSALAPQLVPLQKEAAKADTPDYPIETPVVYNRALDAITQDDDIKIIVIGDNPGKDEQLAKNNKYLVGQAGKIAEGFFKKHPSLAIDFRKNAIILNKTPVHTAKTKHLKVLAKEDAAARDLILQSQLWLAQKTAELAQGVGAQIWLVGYAELKDKGIFVPYRDKLKEAAMQATVYDSLFVFQHFSMNRFMIDLRDFCGGAFDEDALAKNLALLGKKRRDEIFG